MSLAWKNMGRYSGLAGLRLCRVVCGRLPLGDKVGVPDTLDSLCREETTSPEIGPRGAFPAGICLESTLFSPVLIMEAGLELPGVPLGVEFGVDDVLSTRAFRDDDLGVIFELKKVLIGVAISSFDLPCGVRIASIWPPRANRGDTALAGNPAIREEFSEFLVSRTGATRTAAVRPLTAFRFPSGGASLLANATMLGAGGRSTFSHDRRLGSRKVA